MQKLSLFKKTRIFLFALFLSAAVFAETKVELLPWTSPKAFEQLARSQARVDFPLLSNHFENQVNKFFCGPTSVAIVLNALRSGNAKVSMPEDQSLFRGSREHFPKPDYNPVFTRYSQYNVFNAKSDSVKSLAEVFGKPKEGTSENDFGLTLPQLGGILSAHQVQVKVQHMDHSISDAKAKALLINNLSRSGDYVIVNYFRPALGQPGGGHISPLGAYDQLSDSFLIMDVNPNAAPWVWVSANDLMKAMRTADGKANRGFILVEESAGLK